MIRRRLFSWAMRPEAKLVYSMLEHGQWVQEGHRLVTGMIDGKRYSYTKPGEIQLWVCNGMFFLGIYEPFRHNFTLVEKFVLWPMVKRAMSRAVCDKLTNYLLKEPP
jgi:hypothetical protein